MKTMTLRLNQIEKIETPVRPDVDTPAKPKNPDTPYSPKPGTKKDLKLKMKEECQVGYHLMN